MSGRFQTRLGVEDADGDDRVRTASRSMQTCRAQRMALACRLTSTHARRLASVVPRRTLNATPTGAPVRRFARGRGEGPETAMTTGADSRCNPDATRGAPSARRFEPPAAKARMTMPLRMLERLAAPFVANPPEALAHADSRAQLDAVTRSPRRGPRQGSVCPGGGAGPDRPRRRRLLLARNIQTMVVRSAHGTDARRAGQTWWRSRSARLHADRVRARAPHGNSIPTSRRWPGHTTRTLPPLPSAFRSDAYLP